MFLNGIDTDDSHIDFIQNGIMIRYNETLDKIDMHHIFKELPQCQDYLRKYKTEVIEKYILFDKNIIADYLLEFISNGEMLINALVGSLQKKELYILMILVIQISY
jgi:hypothetical protein